MLKIISTKDNIISASYLYLKLIGVKVTEQTVEDTLKNHPNYPSLLSIGDSYNEWNIENISLKLKAEQLTEIPTPFLTYLNSNGGSFAIVKSVNEDNIELIIPDKEKKNERFDDFFKKWTGIVLLAESNENSGEKNYTKNRQKEILLRLRLPSFLLGLLVIFVSIFIFNFKNGWYFNTLLTTKFVGLIISSILLWQSVDNNNPFIQTLCEFGSKTNCNSILSSKAAQITSWLSWSEVGFFYFAGGFISLLLAPSSIILLNILGSFSIIFTFWSIYYQSIIAKQWCSLCLAIIGLLWVEFLIHLSNFPAFFSIKSNQLYLKDSLILFQSFLFAVCIWGLLKPILQKSQQTNKIKDDLRRFKNNPELFLQLLHKQREMPFVPKNLNPVIIGNLDAVHTITMISNPFCQPCAKIHKAIKTLVETNNSVNCQVIFSASIIKRDTRGLVAKGILSLPKDQQVDALHVWYEDDKKDIEQWKKTFNIVENEQAESILYQHQIWVELAKIRGTPTVYLNGFNIPELYQIKDLNGLLKTLSATDFAKS